MKIRCWYCNKIVSSEVQDDFAFRAIAICPECIEKSPETENHTINKDAVITPVEDRQAKQCRFKDDACRLGPDYPCDSCAVYSPES